MHSDLGTIYAENSRILASSPQPGPPLRIWRALSALGCLHRAGLQPGAEEKPRPTSLYAHGMLSMQADPDVKTNWGKKIQTPTIILENNSELSINVS